MGPAEQEEGGSLEVICQLNVLLVVFSRGYGVAALSEGPASGRGHASKRASLAASHEGREIGHVPAEISQLLVNALESHGCCVYVWCVEWW